MKWESYLPLPDASKEKMVFFPSCSNHHFTLLGKRIYVYVVEWKLLFSAQQLFDVICLLFCDCYLHQTRTKHRKRCNDKGRQIHRYWDASEVQEFKQYPETIFAIKVHKSNCLVLSTFPILRYSQFVFLFNIVSLSFPKVEQQLVFLGNSIKTWLICLPVIQKRKWNLILN